MEHHPPPYVEDAHPPVYHDVPDIPHHHHPHQPHLPIVHAPEVSYKGFAKDGPEIGKPLQFGAPLSISVALNKFGSPVYVSTPAPYLLTRRTTPPSTKAPTTPPAPEIKSVRPPTVTPPTYLPAVPAVPEGVRSGLPQPTPGPAFVPGNLAHDPVSHGFAVPPGPGPTPIPGVFPPHPTPSLSFAPDFLNSPAGPPVGSPVTILPDLTTFPGTVPAVPGLVLEPVTPGPFGPFGPLGPADQPPPGFGPFRPAFLNSQNSLGPEAVTAAPPLLLPEVPFGGNPFPAAPAPSAPEVPAGLPEVPRSSGIAQSIFGGSAFGTPVPASTAAPSFVPEPSNQPFQFSTFPTAQASPVTTPSPLTLPPETPVPGTAQPIFLVVNNGPDGSPQLVQLPGGLTGPTGAPINLQDLIAGGVVPQQPTLPPKRNKFGAHQGFQNFLNPTPGPTPTAAPVQPISTTGPPQPAFPTVTESIFGDSVFESQRTQTGGVSIQPLGQSFNNNGFNAIVSEAPTKTIASQPFFPETSAPAIAVENPSEDNQNDGLPPNPFSFSFDTVKDTLATRPRTQPGSTPEIQPTEIVSDAATDSAPAPAPAQSFGSFRIDHSDHPSIVVNEGILDEFQTTPILLPAAEPAVPNNNGNNLFPTSPVKKDDDKKTLQETLLGVLGATSENIVQKKQQQKPKEKNRSNSGNAVVNTLIKEDNIKKKPLDPEFHIQLGPHVVETVSRPDKAKEVEENIHKTYAGQEFFGEAFLKASGNETVTTNIDANLGLNIDVKTSKSEELTLSESKRRNYLPNSSDSKVPTLQETLLGVLGASESKRRDYLPDPSDSKREDYLPPITDSFANYADYSDLVTYDPMKLI